VRGPSPCEVLATLAPPAPPGSGRRHLKIRFLRACTLLCGCQSVSAESILRARRVEAKQRPVFLWHMAYCCHLLIAAVLEGVQGEGPSPRIVPKMPTSWQLIVADDEQAPEASQPLEQALDKNATAAAPATTAASAVVTAPAAPVVAAGHELAATAPAAPPTAAAPVAATAPAAPAAGHDEPAAPADQELQQDEAPKAAATREPEPTDHSRSNSTEAPGSQVSIIFNATYDILEWSVDDLHKEVMKGQQMQVMSVCRGSSLVEDLTWLVAGVDQRKMTWAESQTFNMDFSVADLFAQLLHPGFHLMVHPCNSRSATHAQCSLVCGIACACAPDHNHWHATACAYARIHICMGKS
jgi:hypothetical protein